MTESPGGATVRSVRVVMDASIDAYVAKMKAAGRETDAAFERVDRRLTGINRALTRTERGFDGVSRAERAVTASTSSMNAQLANTDQVLTRTERSIGRNSKALDTFSGRTGLILKTLALIGPAIVPLAAGLVPALSAAAVAGGAAAAGIAVTVLAVQGLGDALDALDTWQLEKTPENLAAVRQEFARIGPDGVQFVRFIDSLEPKLRNLQLIARAGALPGFEDSIRNLLDLLPEAKFLIQDLSETAGDLAADAGESLAGEDFESFFDYLKTDAAPTLDSLSRIVGNFTLAFANLLVALAPATRDATGGLLEFSEGVADASANLESNQGFQRFLAYVRQEGPAALDFLGSAGGALVSLAEAAAPYGSVVLPVLTATADLFSVIASSPVGPVLVAAAAGLTAYGRAADFASPRIAKLKASGISSMAVPNPWAVAAAGLVVAITEVVTADDQLVAATQRAQDALDSGDTSQMRTELASLQEEIDKTTVKLYPEDGLSATDQIPLIGGLGKGLEQAGNLFAHFNGSADEAKDKAKELEDAIAGGGTFLTGYRNAILRTADALLQEKAALEASTEAMRAKRQEALAAFDAETRYAEAVKEATKQARRNSAGINENTTAGRNNRDALSNLASAWNDQEDAVNNNVYAFQKARRNFIDTAVAMGVPRQAARDLARELLEIPVKRETRVSVPTAPAMAGIRAIEEGLARIPDEHVKVYIERVGTMGGPGRDPMAAGGTVRGQRTPYGDKVLAYLAPGEEVISNRHGQADRHRPLLKRINAGRMADGGTAGRSTYTSRRDSGPVMLSNELGPVASTADQVAKSLKKLEARLDKVSTAYEREKSKLESLTSARQSTADAVASSMIKDPFGNGLAGFDLQVEADTQDIRAMSAALATLVKNGLDPKSALYQQLAASADVNTAEQLAALSRGDLADRARRFEARASEASVFGGTVAGQAYDEAIRKQTKATERLERQMDKLEDAIRDLKKVPDKMHDAVLIGAESGTERGSERGTRAGQDEKKRDLAAQVRTGGRPLATRGGRR